MEEKLPSNVVHKEITVEANIYTEGEGEPESECVSVPIELSEDFETLTACLQSCLSSGLDKPLLLRHPITGEPLSVDLPAFKQRTSLLELGFGAQTSDKNAVVSLEGCVAPTDPLDPSLWQESCSSITIKTPTLQRAYRLSPSPTSPILCWACGTTCSQLLAMTQPDAPPPQPDPFAPSFRCGCARAADGTCLFAERSCKETAEVSPTMQALIERRMFEEWDKAKSTLMVSEPAEQLHRRVQGDLRSFVNKYLNKDNQQAALSVIPLARLRERAQELAQELSQQLALIKALLEWFKKDFFSWVNTLPCERCGGKTASAGATEPTAVERMEGGAGRTELHKCQALTCGHTTRFPRYNNPVKLLTWRKGRCGEWANCFTLIVKALGYHVRLVNDYTDHVWVEVWDDAEKRWVHADCCENCLDRPLLYEKGWGKKLTYIIAVSEEGCVDVTPRYTQNFQQLNRGYCSEVHLDTFLQTVTIQQQAALPATTERAAAINHWWLDRQQLLHFLKDPTAREGESGAAVLPGRTTGSVEWRAARGELGNGAAAAAAAQCAVPP
ncbi:unnamed protein product [Vitrella brassicaformis CCMP3155]|uniref:Transglutaminase-like domain-containing protein n=2 Tax=Vitrella brassicaformis TaxID=1169539 RepID=A0A0G4EV46_VITBC|nr:unnamed protein product [Vitrella brassicaformis CCMP3155]|eukprot:CEM02129.1 unnamed protein product [Vitrella brassicaformis CCMP3155]